MTTSYKNLVIMGAAILFIVVFYSYTEIGRSQELINSAEDPVNSMSRGFEDAERDFQEGHAHFQRYDGEYPGVYEHEIIGQFKEHAEIIRLFCGVGLYVDELALRITRHENNMVYVTAYNTRLKTLAGKNFNKAM